KTARNVSSGETVILKAGPQLLLRDRGRSKFADDDGAPVVCNLGRFARRCVATKGEGKQRNRGITCARDVKDLSRLCRNVVTPIWISRNDLSGSDRVVAYPADQFRAEESLAVVFENDGVNLSKTTPNVPGDA